MNAPARPRPPPPSFPDLKGKAVLITGGSAPASAPPRRAPSAENGAKVALNFNANAEEAGKVAADIERAGGKAVLVRGDVTKPEVAAQVVARDRRRPSAASTC